jgi:hypothetical protein
MTITRSRERRLRRSERVARLFAVAVVLVCGCRAPHPGVVVEHYPGDGACACPVPYAATYSLQSVDETGTESTPLQRAPVQHKFQVGFIREADGSLVAYASGRKFPLPEGHYVWQIDPDTQRTRGELARGQINKAIKTVGTVLAYTGAAVVCIAGTAIYGFAAAGGHN